MSKLLVGSIFGPSKMNKRWLNLQLRFLHETTADFDHVVYLNNVGKHDFKGVTKIVGMSDVLQDNAGEAHIHALQYLLSEFRRLRNKYDYFLFLDSDAFPIRKKWMSILLEKMCALQVPEKKMYHRFIATAVRYENLENRLHSSIIFCIPEALDHLTFDMSELLDVAGREERDVWMGEKFQEEPWLVLPMMRSNKYNIHPVWSGVYYDMFYHHGGGSRSAKGRAHRYHDHFASVPHHGDRFRNLLDDPCGYVSELAGWTPGEYARFDDTPV